MIYNERVDSKYVHIIIDSCDFKTTCIYSIKFFSKEKKNFF